MFSSAQPSSSQELPLRVAILTTSFPLTPTAISGAFVLRLVQNLPSSVQTVVITPSGMEAEQLQANANYQLRCFRYAPRRWQQLAHQPGGIPVALRQHRIFYLLLPMFLGSMLLTCLRTARHVDLIHANWSVNGIIAGIAGRLMGKPVITTLRGQDVNRSYSSWIYQLMLRLCMSLSSQIAAVSDSIRAMVAQKFPAQSNKLTVISNGVEQRFLDINNQHKPTRSGHLKFITISNLIPEKGVEQVIEAINLLKAEIDFKLTIVGSGPEERKLRELSTSFGLNEKIHFAGNVAPHEIPKYLEKSDIFVFASHSEGRPNVLLEAMAAGLPIIATCIPGVKEIVRDGETGLWFPPEAVETLANLLRRLSQDDHLRQQLAKNARQFILDQGLFWTHTGSRYAELYRQSFLKSTQQPPCAA